MLSIHIILKYLLPTTQPPLYYGLDIVILSVPIYLLSPQGFLPELIWIPLSGERVLAGTKICYGSDLSISFPWSGYSLLIRRSVSKRMLLKMRLWILFSQEFRFVLLGPIHGYCLSKMQSNEQTEYFWKQQASYTVYLLFGIGCFSALRGLTLRVLSASPLPSIQKVACT
jgi:hypothetical protein